VRFRAASQRASGKNSGGLTGFLRAYGEISPRIDGRSRYKKAALSLRFNHEGFCDELYVYRKTPPLVLFADFQAAFLIAG
jgi:hypothetical protein